MNIPQAATARKIAVLIVDDSGFMRLALRKMLETDPQVRVVGEATTGEEAVQKARILKPDVVTMDVEMPGHGGIEATARIVEQNNAISVIMVSSLTRAAADVTLKAIAVGAVDYISKASSFVDLDIVAVKKDLLRKIHYWTERRGTLHQLPSTAAAAASRSRLATTNLKPAGRPDLLLIGASTGGPRVIPELLRLIPGPLPCPVVIALHMPPVYTQSFAEHIQDRSGHRAHEGVDGETLVPGQVVVAAGGLDTFLQKNAVGRYTLRVKREDSYPIHPSVDALFSSCADCGGNALSIVLTGMGDDGLAGARALNRRRLPVLVQNEVSSLVYGMPRAVAEAGLASEILDIEGIARRVTQWLK